MQRLIRYKEAALKKAEGQSRKAEKVRLARKQLTKMLVLATALMFGLAFAGLREMPFVQAQDDDGRRTVSYAMGSTGLVAGEGLRTTLTNFGNRRITVQTKFIDADGVVVKQEPLTFEPGEMHSFAISRSEMSGDEAAALLRIELSAQRRDAKDVLVSNAVIVWTTGRISFPLKDLDGDGRLDNFEIQQ